MLTSLLVLSALAPFVAAQREPIIIHPYIALDGFMPGTAGKGLQEDAQAASVAVAGLGYDVKGQVVTKPAPSLRGGIMAELSERFDLGFGVAYVHGPDSKAEIVATAPSQTGTITDQRTIRFFRYLLEPAFHIRLGDPWSFHLGAGVGYAQGTVSEKITCTGNACVRQGEIGTGKSDWSGLTWEVSPYASYGGAIFGARYAVFPKFAGSNVNSKITWNTAGIFLGYRY